MPASSPGWQRLELPSGARVILAPLSGRTSVSVSLLCGVGSRWEQRRLAGISHFLEHIVFKGTERYPDSRAVSESVEGVGGVLNASTDKELTAFWARVPRARLELAIDVLTDLVFAPKIEPHEVERERKVVLEELSTYLDQPSDLVQMDFDELIWKEHPLARDPAGSRASLARIGAPELTRYRSGSYRPERLVAVLSGGLEPSRAVRLLERRLEAALANQPDGLALGGDGGVPPEPSPGLELKVRRRRGEQVHLLLGARCSSYLSSERWILDVLNTILGEGMSSRLFMELRERQALAYDVHSFTARHRDSGAFGIYIATQPERAETAARGALAEVRRLAQEPLPSEDLNRTKEQIEGRMLLQTESAGALSEFLGHQELLTGAILSPAQVVEHVKAVTAAEVQDLAGRLLRGRGWRLAAVGPQLDRERLEEALAAGLATA